MNAEAAPCWTPWVKWVEVEMNCGYFCLHVHPNGQVARKMGQPSAVALTSWFLACPLQAAKTHALYNESFVFRLIQKKPRLHDAAGNSAHHKQRV